MLFLSALLPEQYPYEGANLTSALASHGIPYTLLPNARDIWLRDFMPVQTHSGRPVSFRYEPSYLDDHPELRTDFKADIAPQLGLPVTYSDINLDGGNVVFSPSRRRAIISDRIFAENHKRGQDELLRELEELLEAEVIIIPSLKSDMTGHADGMVRFVDEDTVIGNNVPGKKGLEQSIKDALKPHGIDVIDFPYFSSRGISASGCYLNFLDAGDCIFLPMFGVDMDAEAVDAARRIFHKEIVPVQIPRIAKEGGCLNCISWELTDA